MDFSRLPDPAFLKIFEYLPLEDCIRVGRVDKSFRRIGQFITSHTKSLNLFEDRFRNLTPDQLAVILDLCWSNLEMIKFPTGGLEFGLLRTMGLGNLDTFGQELATTFSNYHCPRLTDIDLGCAPIDHAVFGQLIRNSPNLECLIWHKEFVGFPDFTHDRLKKMCLNLCNDSSLQTLIGRCPNLEELVLYESGGNGNAYITASVLDEFFGSIPRAQRITINFSYMDPIVFEETELVNLCNLPLTKLSICYCRDGDDWLLHKVATSFPHLRELSIDDLEPTNQGISSLAALKELQVIRLALSGHEKPAFDQGFRQMAANCKKLRKLDVGRSTMTGGTLVNLLRSCSKLERVVIWDIKEVDSPEEAVVILDCLAGMPKREITIECRIRGFEYFGSVWESEQAKAAIKKLEENDGLKIKIE